MLSFLRPRRNPWSRAKVILAAILTGGGAAWGILAGVDQVTGAVVVASVAVGLGAALATILVEDVVVSAVGHRRRRRRGVKGDPLKDWQRRDADLGLGRRIRSEMKLQRLRRRVRGGLPARQAMFQERRELLRKMVRMHEESRAATPSSWVKRMTRRERRRIVSGPPTIIMIHGKPGCGKTELALALAHEVADQYPHGAVYVNMGLAGNEKPPAEVLKTLLDKLKWPAAEMPEDTNELAKILRSITARRRFLFVLDAARSKDQIRRVLPLGTGCGVIINSRRDLSFGIPNARSIGLSEPDEDEAIDILRSAARVLSEVRPEAAAEIASFCGHLPLALRAAGERVAAGADLADVADLLRDDQTRLEFLDTQIRKVYERVASEYQRLLSAEREAIQWLTLVPSPTLDATALHLLLQIPIDEAETCLAYLSEVRLIDVVRTSPASGTVKYEFSPLVRLLAEGELRRSAIAPGTMKEALDRWDEHTLSRFEAELAQQSSAGHPPAAWLASVRAEYPSVRRAVMYAYERESWDVCWGIAARMGGCVAGDVDVDEVLRTFEKAVDAAMKGNSPIGGLDTRLAKATFLTEVERYPDAFAMLTEVGLEAQQLLQRHAGAPNADALMLRHAISHRKRAEAYLQAARNDLAELELTKALSLARQTTDEVEAKLLRVLRAELHHVEITAPLLEEINSEQADDEIRYRYHLVLSESERRLGRSTPGRTRRGHSTGSPESHWQAAEDHLRAELDFSRGDTRRTANLHYRLSRLMLDHWSSGQPTLGLPIGDTKIQSKQDPLLKRAVRRASSAIVLFQQISDPIGVIRARIQLARALTAVGLHVDAEVECAQANDALAGIGRDNMAFLPLAARIARVRAELLLYRDDPQDACEQLIIASRLFARCKDWTSQASVNSVMRLIGDAGFPTGSVPFSLDHVFAGDEVIMGLDRAGVAGPVGIPHQRLPEGSPAPALIAADLASCC